MLDQLDYIDKQLFLLLNGSDSQVLDHFALVETSHFAWIPFVLTIVYVIIKTSSNFKKTLLIFCMIGVLYLLSSVLVSNFFQPSIARLRPGVDLSFMHLVDSVNQTTGGIHGMCSHQASKLMAFSIFLSFLIRDMKFSLCTLSWTLLHSWVLIYLGHYYPFDVLVGFFWGGLVSLFIYLLYAKIERRNFEVLNRKSEQSTSSGYLHVDIITINVVFLGNLIAILFYSLFKQ